RSPACSERGGCLRVRHLRKGAVTAVPDLARPGGASRPRAARARRPGAPGRCARPHPALVPLPLWFPSRYWRLALEFDAASSWLVLARDLTLVALLLVLMTEVRREPSRSA